MARPQAEPLRIVERRDRRQHPVQVEQWLAHAHEHDVREALAVGGQAAGGVAHLVDDLGGLEVAPEPELARRTERAADGAPGLARDAQRVPLARRAAGRVVHQDGLDELAVVESMEGLLGQPAVGDAKLGVVDRVEAEVASQRRPDRNRQGPHLGRIGQPAVLPGRIRDLAGAERGLALVRHPGGELVRGQPREPAVVTSVVTGQG